MTERCPSCGARRRASAAFCPSCGARLGGAAAATASEAHGPLSARTGSRLLWLALVSYFTLMVSSLVVLASAPVSVESVRVVQVVLLSAPLATYLASARWHPNIGRSLAWPRRVKAGVIGRILLGVFAGLAAAELLGLVMPLSDAQTFSAYREQGQSFGHALLDYCLLAPFLEETVFRGIVLGALLVPLSRSGALWTSSLMFATLHLTPLTFVHHTLLGLVAGYARLETRSLLPPILIHAAYNAVVVSLAWSSP